MSAAELFLVAAALSADAFAVAACIGTGRSAPGKPYKAAVVAGLYFGVFQAAMPMLGHALAGRFAERVASAGYLLSFALLIIIGGKMIAGSFKAKKDPNANASVKLTVMLPLAAATSADAFAAGVSFAFLDLDIVPAALTIGGVTFVLSAVGVMIGKFFGARRGSWAEFAGGAVLALMGLKILFDYLV